MAVLSSLDAKTIDELKELRKLTGLEMTIVSTSEGSKKVSIDTIIGFGSKLIDPNRTIISDPNGLTGQCIIFVPEGEEISVSERTPGCFYLEEAKQTSVRTKINVPTSVIVSKTLGLRRV